MPSSATITSFFSFAPATVIRSAQVNANFDTFRGHIIPVDPNTSMAATTRTYDLGAADHMWANAFLGYATFYQNTSTSLPATPVAGSMALYFKSDGKSYVKNPAGVETALGGGQLVVTGTRSVGITVTAAGITYSTTGGARQQIYIVGDTTTGTTVTTNPQISAGSEDGQELILVGTSDEYPVTFSDGLGLRINGEWNANSRSTLMLRWDTLLWVEMGRNGI